LSFKAFAIGVMDFDIWRRAEPAVDLALFLTSVTDVGLSAISLVRHLFDG